MIGFRELIRNDRELFLNYTEFAEQHNIRYKIGVETRDLVIVGIKTDGIRAKSESEKKQSRGLYIGYVNFYCRSEDLKPQPHQGTLIYLDGTRYSVLSIEDQCGVTRLQLEGYHQ